MKMNNKGFSLVELIVVIAIMAILVGVLAPSVIGQVEKSRVSKDEQNLEALASAVATSVTTDLTDPSQTVSPATVTGGTNGKMVSSDNATHWFTEAMSSLGKDVELVSNTYASQAITITISSNYKVTVSCGTLSITK